MVTAKLGLLVLLGLLWAMRLAAIKAAGLSGVPIHVVVSVAATGIAAFFTLLAVARRDWPPIDRATGRFYLLSGTLGFLAPFALESAVAPQLPVFVFVVVIATMPLLTLVLSILVGAERPALVPILAVAIGFAGAMAIVWDLGPEEQAGSASGWWIAAGFGVPLLYAINTVFVATRWPAHAGPIDVAHAQALIVAGAALLGSVATGTLGDWRLAGLNAPALALIVLGEGLALLAYLRIARDFGATWVSFANYVSMVFAAAIGALWFGDRLTPVTIAAAIVIAGAVVLYQWWGSTGRVPRVRRA